MNTEQSSGSLIEKQNWDRYFEEALAGKGQEHTNGLWWSIVDQDVNRLVHSLFCDKSSISVLEAGAGSGGTSLDLAHYIDLSTLCLVDISPKALAFAKSMTPSTLQSKTQYIEADLLDLDLGSKFDLVWNIGVIEHYSPADIQKMVDHLFRHVKAGGYLVLGMPNRNSIPVAKAAFLGSNFAHRFFPFLPGYRNTTEILYSDSMMRNLIAKVTQSSVRLEHAGSILWVGAPRYLVRALHRKMKPNRFSFLSLFIVRKL